MRMFEFFILWVLTLVVTILACQVIYLCKELKNSNERIDNISEALSVILLMGESSVLNNYKRSDNPIIEIEI